MLTVILVVAGLLVATVFVLGFLFIAGIRYKWGFVLRPLFSMQRSFINPTALQTAGKDGGKQAVVRHLGRTTGRQYETPVDVVDTTDGFLIALPYGSETNWVRNVLASGSAIIVHEGRAWAADRPEIVPLRQVVASFPASGRRAFGLFGVNECLRLRKGEPAPDAPVAPAAPSTAPSS